MASEKQRKMIEYTKNMQINEKKDALPSRKRSASHIKLKIKILRLVFGIEDTTTNLNQAIVR